MKSSIKCSPMMLISSACLFVLVGGSGVQSRSDEPQGDNENKRINDKIESIEKAKKMQKYTICVEGCRYVDSSAEYISDAEDELTLAICRAKC
ncbi:hypothetical protein IMCC20628_03554 [Hoeflea sp. IMCC20628]|nr:hypothetical protein IMCC20628_03554 [Hoeflea sp. IMCC20628]